MNSSARCGVHRVTAMTVEPTAAMSPGRATKSTSPFAARCHDANVIQASSSGLPATPGNRPHRSAPTRRSCGQALGPCPGTRPSPRVRHSGPESLPAARVGEGAQLARVAGRTSSPSRRSYSLRISPSPVPQDGRWQTGHARPGIPSSTPAAGPHQMTGCPGRAATAAGAGQTKPPPSPPTAHSLPSPDRQVCDGRPCDRDGERRASRALALGTGVAADFLLSCTSHPDQHAAQGNWSGLGGCRWRCAKAATPLRPGTTQGQR
jgi:hypothetical protein